MVKNSRRLHRVVLYTLENREGGLYTSLVSLESDSFARAYDEEGNSPKAKTFFYETAESADSESVQVEDFLHALFQAKILR